MKQPQPLLLDEPFANLDAHRTAEFRQEVTLIQRGFGVTTIMATNESVDAMTMADPALLALIAATFLLAGAVKGVIGLGLPTVSLGILTAALDLPTAMALLLVPSLATNV